MSVDLIHNGQAQGAFANELLANGRTDVGMMKPWISEKDGKPYVTIFSGGDPVDPSNYKTMPTTNAATLRRDEWKALDDAVVRIAETRLNGVQDLIDKGLPYNLGNGFGYSCFWVLILEHRV